MGLSMTQQMKIMSICVGKNTFWSLIIEWKILMAQALPDFITFVIDDLLTKYLDITFIANIMNGK